MTKTVFASYSRKNSKKVYSIVNRLIESHGYDVWIDKRKLAGGDRWNDKISKAILEKDVFLLFASEHAFNSVNVLREVRCANEAGRKVIPLFLEKANIPPELVFLHELQIIRTSTPQYMEELIKAIESERETPSLAKTNEIIGDVMINVGGNNSGDIIIGNENATGKESDGAAQDVVSAMAEIPASVITPSSKPVENKNFLEKYVVDHRYQQIKDEKWFEKILSMQPEGTFIYYVEGVHGVGKTWLLRYLSMEKKTPFLNLSRMPEIPYIDLAECDSRNLNSDCKYSTPDKFIQACRKIISRTKDSPVLVVDHAPDGERNDYIVAFEKEILEPFLSSSGKIVVIAHNLNGKAPWILDRLNSEPETEKIQINVWSNKALDEYSNKNPRVKFKIEEYKKEFGELNYHIPLLVECVLKNSSTQVGIREYFQDYLRAYNESDTMLPVFAVLSWVDNFLDLGSTDYILKTVFSENVFSNYSTAEAVNDLKRVSWIDRRTYQWVQPFKTALQICTSSLLDDVQGKRFLAWKSKVVQQ